MSLKCPKCDTEFPKSQNGVIPYSIVDFNTMLKLTTAGTREDANMFCQACNTPFIATKESYRKLVKISYLVFLPALVAAIACLVLSGIYSRIALGCFLAGGLLRLAVPHILNQHIIELEETTIKDVSKVSLW